MVRETLANHYVRILVIQNTSTSLINIELKSKVRYSRNDASVTNQPKVYCMYSIEILAKFS